MLPPYMHAFVNASSRLQTLVMLLLKHVFITIKYSNKNGINVTISFLFYFVCSHFMCVQMMSSQNFVVRFTNKCSFSCTDDRNVTVILPTPPTGEEDEHVSMPVVIGKYFILEVSLVPQFYYILYIVYKCTSSCVFQSPRSKCCNTELPLRVGLIHTVQTCQVFMSLHSAYEPHP